MLLSNNCPPSRTELTAEVLFGNGQAPAILATNDNPFATLTVFPIDLDYDGIPDAGVITALNGVTSVQYFRYDGHGGFTSIGSTP